MCRTAASWPSGTGRSATYAESPTPIRRPGTLGGELFSHPGRGRSLPHDLATDVLWSITDRGGLIQRLRPVRVDSLLVRLHQCRLHRSVPANMRPAGLQLQDRQLRKVRLERRGSQTFVLRQLQLQRCGTEWCKAHTSPNTATEALPAATSGCGLAGNRWRRAGWWIVAANCRILSERTNETTAAESLLTGNMERWCAT